MAWRIALLGLLFIGLLVVLLLQMWQMQVTNVASYEERAANNLVRLIELPAPRGDIRDANGELLAGSGTALAAVLEGGLLPEDDPDLVQRVATFAGLPAVEIEEMIEKARTRGDRLTLVEQLTTDQAAFLWEREEDFPGVSVLPQPVRFYQNGDLLPHILGYIGRPNDTDLENPDIRGTDVVGKAGVERQYDEVLRGDRGTVKYLVRADGTVINDLVGEVPSQAGGTVFLTIDLELQEVLRNALIDGLELARETYREGGCEPGDDDKGCPVRSVGVVMNAQTGAILAMDSVPAFDPNIFVGGVSQAELDALPDGVFNNFAIQGQYAPASTFKPITYVTAYEEDISPTSVDSIEEEILCTPQLEARFTDASQQIWRNWRFPRDDGQQDIHRALVRSCNVYFWELALSIWDENKETERENILQDWARQLGLGAPTGIDLPFEQSGLIPDRALFEDWADNSPARLDPARLELASPWLGGDLLQVAVGQGSTLATPVQLATAYAAMLNGGTVWEPFVVAAIADAEGNRNETSPVAANTVALDPATIRVLKQDLQRVVNESEGTAASAFAEFGERQALVGGKTGTAEVIKATVDDEGNRVPSVTTALFVGAAPINNPEYVVVIVIERGGSGGQIAAPTARQIFQYLLNGPDAVTPILLGEVSER